MYAGSQATGLIWLIVVTGNNVWVTYSPALRAFGSFVWDDFSLLSPSVEEEIFFTYLAY